MAQDHSEQKPTRIVATLQPCVLLQPQRGVQILARATKIRIAKVLFSPMVVNTFLISSIAINGMQNHFFNTSAVGRPKMSLAAAISTPKGHI